MVTAPPYRAYDCASTKRMGDAYDAVCGRLHGISYPDAVLEVIARRVIEIARGSSEQNPDRLADAVMTSLGIKL